MDSCQHIKNQKTPKTSYTALTREVGHLYRYYIEHNFEVWLTQDAYFTDVC